MRSHDDARDATRSQEETGKYHYDKLVCMPATKNQPGATARTVADNVRRLRESQNLTRAEMVRRLGNIGKPIAALGLLRIEEGDRRVDVDDLMALSVALRCAPAALLMPAVNVIDDRVSATGLGEVDAGDLWNWIVGDDDTADPSDVDYDLDWSMRSQPVWVRAKMAEEGRKMARRASREQRRGDN
ncbi:helix-turn-helix transcriptional regulator [Gordonia sp. CPCC 206044]|uniref:helix-turn-helix domain-containing protein n=1 Tax=Gordonia sp. CPCC 206044 TaxID=3140793 RepID=UPI003AF374FC